MERLSLIPSSTPSPPSFLAGLGYKQASLGPYLMLFPGCLAPSSSVWSPLPDDRIHQVVWSDLKKYLAFIPSRVKFKLQVWSDLKNIPCFDSSSSDCFPPSCSDSSPSHPRLKKALCPTSKTLDKESGLFRLPSFYASAPPSPSFPSPSATEPYWGFLAGSINCRDSDQSRSGADSRLEFKFAESLMLMEKKRNALVIQQISFNYIYMTE